MENFCTEALAAAAREEPWPLIGVLRDHQLITYAEVPTEVSIHTQVGVADAGIIDLIVELGGSGWTAEVWVEVKVGAGESGAQLTNYQHWVSARPSPPRLAILGPRPLPGHRDMRWIPWQAIWNAIGENVSGLYWSDLKSFLEEIHMADAFNAPIVAREAGALLDGQALLRKVSRLISQTVDDARPRWPQLGWPKSANDVDEQLLWQFYRHGRLACPVRTAARNVWVCIGTAQAEESADFRQAEPHLTVWIDQPPRQTDLRRRLLAEADRGHLPKMWTRRLQGWWPLFAHERLTAFADLSEARTWLLERAGELEASGILGLLSETSSTTPSTEDNNDHPLDQP